MAILAWSLRMALGVALLAGAVLALGAWRWSRSTLELLDLMETGRRGPAFARFDFDALASLPAPVQRYFAAALTEGQPLVSAVTITQRGSFNLGSERESWAPFHARQRVVIQPPGFVWDARVSAMPGVRVHVHDAYVAGEGVLRPSVLGLFELTELRGGGEVAKGELLRYLAEAAWYPTALLPGQGITWEPIDARSARATLVDRGVQVSLHFVFGADGLIESVFAERRGRTVGKSIVMTPWEGRWYDYQTRAGMRVPLSGEVAWLTPEGRKPYWRGSITSIDYEFTR